MPAMVQRVIAGPGPAWHPPRLLGAKVVIVRLLRATANFPPELPIEAVPHADKPT